MASSALDGKRIVLGVTGSIAAYKAADLASKLAQEGALVDAVLTEAATRFVAPLTFQAVSGRRAYVPADLWGADAHVLHISLAREADALAVAPVTAATLARLARGQAEDLLGLTVLAAGAGDGAPPLVLAPAMDGAMYDHPATQDNLAVLAQRGAVIVGPEEGHLASGLVARGRMSEPAAVLGQLRYQLSRGGPLAGRRVVVTAGGTREPLDPVRVLANRSSGRQGFALAQAALDAGAEVVLVAGPGCLDPPVGTRHVAVRTAQEMADATLEAVREADALLMAAAVADFRPVAAVHKIKKDQGLPAIEFEPTVDVLLAVAEARAAAGRPHVVVGFAAETEDLVANARGKLERKGLDLVVANDVGAPGAGFDADTNRVTVLDGEGRAEAWPLMSKAEAASRIVAEVVGLLGGPSGVGSSG